MKTPKKSQTPVLLLLLAGLGALVFVDNFPSQSEPEPAAPRTAMAPMAATSVETRPQGGTTADPNASPGDNKLAGLSLNPLGTLERDQLGDTLKRPLFTTSRRAYKAPPPPPPQPVAVRPPPVVTEPTYVLVGVMLGRNKRIALLRSRDSAGDIHVKQGDKLGQWNVKSVESDAVILNQGEQSFTLQVFPK